MSDLIDGFFWIYITDKQLAEELKIEFAEQEHVEIMLDEYISDEYIITDHQDDIIQEVYFCVPDNARVDELCKYVLKKYKPDVLIFSHEKKVYVNRKKSSLKKALDILKSLSPKVKFYLSLETNDFDTALGLLADNQVNLEDDIFGIKIHERCLIGSYAPLMEYAVKGGYYNHLLHTHEFGYKVDDGYHVIHRLIHSSNVEVLNAALALGADPDGLDENKETLLHLVPRIAFTDEFIIDAKTLVKLMCSYGADINKKNWESNTPLLTLAEGVLDYEVEDEDIVCELISCYLDSGANVDVYDRAGAGLLTYFSKMDKVKGLLLDAKPNLRPENGDFDVQKYILSRNGSREESLDVEECGDYFLTCLKLGFIDHIFEAENVKILKQASGYVIYSLLKECFTMSNCSDILRRLNKNDIPIFIENTSHENMDRCNSLDIAKALNKQDLVDYFNSLSSYKAVSISTSIWAIGKVYEIESRNNITTKP